MSDRMSVTVLCALGLVWLAGNAVAGDQSPPVGPVGPTMKTLVEVEPRIPVGPVTTPGDATAVYLIQEPGSYYLVGDVLGVAGKLGIRITAPNVTLDLMGFSLVGPGSGTDNGILGDFGSDSLVVRNGVIRGWGNVGIGTVSVGVFEDLVVVDNSDSGLVLASGSVVERCVMRGNFEGVFFNGRGIARDCSTENNTSIGIGAGGGLTAIGCASLGDGQGFQGLEGSSFSGCSAQLSTGLGYLVSDSSTLQDCVAHANGGHGFYVAYPGIVLSNCSAIENAGDGFECWSGGVLEGCSATKNQGSGIRFAAFGGAEPDRGGVVRGCTASGNTVNGIEVATGSTVEACVVSGNTGDGIHTAERCVVRDCLSELNGDDGISVGSRCVVIGNTCVSNDFGIYVSPGLTDCRIEGNTVESSTFTGFLLSGTDQLVVRNMARNNSTNYSITIATNQVGPYVTALGEIASTSPWANFSVGGTAVRDGGPVKGAEVREAPQRTAPEVVRFISPVRPAAE